MPDGARRPARGRAVLADGRPWHAMAVLLAATLSACESRSSAQPSDEPTAETTDPLPAEDPFIYVAMGDSYTAAHGVPGTNWLDGCLQSDRNYPNLVAEALPDAELIDVSCSGAATHHMWDPRVYGTIEHAPQLDALTVDTDLVTISIGYNDFRLFATLFGRCAELAKKDPDRFALPGPADPAQRLRLPRQAGDHHRQAPREGGPRHQGAGAGGPDPGGQLPAPVARDGLLPRPRAAG